jgi:hypothetical protein
LQGYTMEVVQSVSPAGFTKFHTDLKKKLERKRWEALLMGTEKD